MTARRGREQAEGELWGCTGDEAPREEKNNNLRSADKRERPKSYRAKAEESCVCWNRAAWDGMTGAVFPPGRLAVKGRGYRRDGDGDGETASRWSDGLAPEEEDCCLSNRAQAGLFDAGWMDCCRIATLGSSATAEGPGRESRRHGSVWCWVSLGKEESR